MTNKHFEKAGYGIAETGLTASEVLIRLYLLIFYTDIVGLEPKLAGYAAAIAIVWDAITDFAGRIHHLFVFTAGPCHSVR